MTVYGPAPGSGPGLLFEPTDTAERCDDPTPRGVIRAALEAAVTHRHSEWDDFYMLELGEKAMMREWFGHEDEDYPAAPTSKSLEPVRVLDVGAGYGAWSSELRRLANRQGWPVHITGVEILEARRKHLEKWCDDWAMDDWRAALTVPYTGLEHTSFDLAIGNPPFDELTGPKGAKRPPEECMPAVLLRHAPAVLLLHTQQAFLKSEAGRASWRANPPAASWLVPGGVKFRGPDVGADSRCYQVTLWLRDHTGPCSVYMLDDLPPSARSWTVPPGTEEPSPCKSQCAQLEGNGPKYWVRKSGGTPSIDATIVVCPDCKGSGLDPNGDLPTAPGYVSKRRDGLEENALQPAHEVT